ncbi:MAG: hypothetical protein IKK90_04475 [Bacteroides sp.]|nr:hypothetical protein [Bacteroides sp.]
MSGNEVEKLKSLRGKLAVLCPETDGLQAKHRIKRVLKGKNRQDRVEEMQNVVEREILPLIDDRKENITKRVARIASLVYRFEGFGDRETYRLLKKENIKNYY